MWYKKDSFLYYLGGYMTNEVRLWIIFNAIVGIIASVISHYV